MTHTTGPWEIKANLLDIETRYGDWHYIDIKGVALVRDPHMPEGKANARLIAVAPDLLAACKVALNAINLNDETLTAREHLQAAITSAEVTE